MFHPTILGSQTSRYKLTEASDVNLGSYEYQ